jgi:hypothetical protein
MEFYCKHCDYTTKKPSDWLKHVETQKHKRFGKKKEHSCNECDYKCKTSWNMTLHTLTQHSSKEEREKQKHYCADCDTVFFTLSSKTAHINGIKHKNYVEAIKELNKINQTDVK